MREEEVIQSEEEEIDSSEEEEIDSSSEEEEIDSSSEEEIDSSEEEEIDSSEEEEENQILEEEEIQSSEEAEDQILEESVNIYDWLDDQNSKALHLTLGNVRMLEVGQELDVVIFDGNFEEYGMWEKYKKNEAYDPEDILQYNRTKIIYKGDFMWDIVMSDCGTFEHPVHLNVEHLPTNYTWVEIDETDKGIHITREILSEGEEMPNDTSTHLHNTEIPDTTRAGWRGPIMLWEYVKDMPKIHWHIRA